MLSRFVFLLALAFVPIACAGPAATPAAPPTPLAAAHAVSSSSSSSSLLVAPVSSWAKASQSAAASGGASSSTEACGVHDDVLARVAATMAASSLESSTSPDVERVTALLRENGEPHVRPRMLVAKDTATATATAATTEEQLGVLKTSALTRCGVAKAGGLLVAIAIDALADLEPLPTRARTGEWLTLTAPVHANLRSAKVVVLGPRGLPRTVPTSIDRVQDRAQDRVVVRARFALDRPGAFTVQLVGDVVDQGPRPLLEARVFADVEPMSTEDAEASIAPGEDAASSNDAAALAKMIAALRTSEALGTLTRDARLDALAQTHANQMRSKKTVAHDLGTGEGDLTTRFEAESLAARVVGENVARAKSTKLAHRALHASPSHRMNLLRPDFTHVGIAVTDPDATGNVYACEVFAASLQK